MSEKQKLEYAYPPDISKSQKHFLATRIFKGITKHSLTQECQCCQRRVGEEVVPHQCCYSVSQLAFLGTGVPLFFTFLMDSIILLIILACVFAAFGIYSNIVGSSCGGTSTCESNIFNTLSILNKISQTNYLSIQNYMLLGFVVINIFVLQCFRYHFRKLQQDCDQIIDTASDYSIIIRRLPQQCTNKDIQTMIQQRRGFLTDEERRITDNLRVIHIILSYSLRQYQNIKQKNLQEFKKSIKQQKYKQFVPTPLPTPSVSASLAIVVFAKQQSKKFFIHNPNICQRIVQCICNPCVPLSDYQIKGERVSIERAPQPDDIVWENAGISIAGSILRKIIYTFIGIILLFGGGAAQYGLAIAQNSMTNQTSKLLMGTASSVIVVITNIIIQQFLIFSTTKERDETLTQFNTTLTVKISFFQFLNTGIFVVLANLLADLTHFSLQTGMTSDITQIMILNAATPNISTFLLNYFNIVGKVKRYLVRNQYFQYSQLEANLIYENPPAEIPYKYAYVIKTLWLTAFYAPLVPIVVPISIAGLLLYYWVEKCLYGGSYKSPNMLSSMVNDSAIELLQYFALIISIGQFLVYLYFFNFRFDLIPNYWSIPIYISLGLSFVNLLLPMQAFNKKCIKLQSDSISFQNYQAVEQKFQVTYQMTNPAYSSSRKRKRQQFFFNALFANKGFPGIQMTNLGFLGGANRQDNNEINKELLSSPNQNIQTNPLMALGSGMLIPNYQRNTNSFNTSKTGQTLSPSPQNKNPTLSKINQTNNQSKDGNIGNLFAIKGFPNNDNNQNNNKYSNNPIQPNFMLAPANIARVQNQVNSNNRNNNPNDVPNIINHNNNNKPNVNNYSNNNPQNSYNNNNHITNDNNNLYNPNYNPNINNNNINSNTKNNKNNISNDHSKSYQSKNSQNSNSQNNKKKTKIILAPLMYQKDDSKDLPNNNILMKDQYNSQQLSIILPKSQRKDLHHPGQISNIPNNSKLDRNISNNNTNMQNSPTIIVNNGQMYNVQHNNQVLSTNVGEQMYPNQIPNNLSNLQKPQKLNKFPEGNNSNKTSAQKPYKYKKSIAYNNISYNLGNPFTKMLNGSNNM